MTGIMKLPVKENRMMPETKPVAAGRAGTYEYGAFKRLSDDGVHHYHKA